MHAPQASPALKKSGEQGTAGRVRAAPASPTTAPAKRAKVYGDQVVPELRGRESLRPPSFLRRLKNAAIGTGFDIRLKVAVNGCPLPTLAWFRNNLPLPPDPGEYGALWIRDCKSTDAGVYTCVARNVLGEVHTSAVLAVLEVEDSEECGEEEAFEPRKTAPSEGHLGPHRPIQRAAAELECLTDSTSESTLSSLRTAPELPLPPEQAGAPGQRSPAWSWSGAAAAAGAVEEEEEEEVAEVEVEEQEGGAAAAVAVGAGGGPAQSPRELREDSPAKARRDPYPSPPRWDPIMAQRAPFPASLKARPLSPKAQRAAGVGGQPTTPLTPRRKLSTPAAYSDTVPAEFQDKPKAGGDGSSLEPGLPRRDSSGSLSPHRGSKVFDRVRYLETFPERRRSFDLSDGQAWPGFRKSRSFDQADTRQARRRRTSFSDLLGAEAGQRRSLFRQKAASFDERTPSRDIELKISEELGRIKRSAMASPLAKPVLRSPVLERAVNRELSSRKARQAAAEPPALPRKPLQRALATAGPDHHEPETLGEDGGLADANHIGVWRRDPQPSPGSDQAPAPARAHPPFVVVEMVKKVTLTPETRLPTSAARPEASGGLKPLSPLSKETLDRVDVANLGSEAGARLGLAPLSPAGDPGQQGDPNPRTAEDQEHPKMESPTDGARPPALEKSARKASRTRSKKPRPVSPELESSDDSYISAGEDPLEPPLFEIAIADTVVTVGSGVLLKCIITGTPLPEVVWKKGGEVVRTSPGLVVKAEGERHTLFIPSAAPLHGGLYSVTASNEVGISSCCASVHVHTGPAPDTCPQVVPAGLYSPITSDDEYLSPLEDLGDLGYKGRQAQHSPDTRDPQTTETRQAVIDTHFKAPPTFEVSLSNQTVGEGEDVSLTVRVLGEPKPIIYWLRNREPVKADGRHCVLEGEDGGFQLNIATAQRSDAGMYSCKAINEYGTRQCSCKMDVKGPRDVQTLTIVSGVRDVTVNAGESACFECEVRGPAELDVDWLADGKLVQPALLNCKMHFDGKRCKLQLQSVHEDDTGVYTCKLSTGAEEKLSSAQLTVLPSVAPLFTRKLQDLAVVEGRGAHLNVKVSGTPPPTLTWTHYGEKVIESEDVRILKDNGLHSLLILHAVSENEGEYSAIAQNPHGDAFCSAELYVEEPRPVISSPMAKLEKMPSIPEEPEIPENEMERFTMPDFLKAIQNVDVTEGKDTVLECQVTGLPYPSISWYHNGQKLLSTEERRMTQYKDVHRLVIRCVDHSHAGVYKTVIANKVGKATSYAHIYVSDVVPDPPAGPAAVVGVTGRTVTLRWTRPKKLDPSIDPSTLTYVIQSQVLGTPQWHILKTNVKETTFTIQSLNKGIQYLFRIQSATPKSCSKPCPVSEPVKLLDRGPYLEEAPCIIDKPDIVYAVENQSVCITCTLNYVQADVTWTREGVLLTHWPRQCELTMPDDDQHSLCLRRVGRMDVGDLLLTASNTHGVDTAHILLQLAEAPRFESIMEDLVVRPEENARLGVVVEGRPLPVIHWYKDDEELLESSHLSFVYEDSECSLVILNTAPADSGVYTCTARNLAGDVSCKAELTVAKGKVESEDPMDDEDTILRKMRLLTDYYDIHHEIGRGAFSCVKQVTEKSSSVDYAAKLISFRATPRDQAVRELRILSQLDHERVVYFHDAFEKKNTLTIVMELCPQEELFDRLVKKPAVLETEVRYYVQQILEGIRYLHQNNILHLDIKPDNILLAHPGSDSVRICDFGNALELTPDTPHFSRLGTPEYVAPEIIAQTPVSTATDVWPVGVIAYIGLTGVSPFSGENDRATLLNVKNYDVAFEEKMFADLSRESKGFVTSLLVEDKHRPSAEDCLHHVWFLSVDGVKGKMISTDPLKSLVSRRKWQRSLISYKSSMVVRSIPEVLADPSGPPSLGLPRQLRDPRLSSSSDSDEIDELPLLPMPTPPEFRASRLPLHHLRGQAVAEAQAQAQARAQEEQGVRTDDQGPTQAPSEGGTETETGPQAAPKHGPKAPARKRPPEAGPSDSSDEEAPQAGRGPSSEAADWPPAQAHSSASRRRGEFRRGSSADSALALLGTGESLGLEAGAGAQLSPAGGRLKKSVSMELPRRSPSPSPRRPEEGSGGRRRAGPASEDYSLKLELLRQRLLRGGSVDNKMSGLRGPLLERLGLPDGEPQHLGPLPLERQALRPPRPDKQSRLARAASSDSTPTQEEPERRALRKTASFSQAEPPTLHRRLGAPLEIPLQPAGPRAPSPELQFPLKESPSLSALTDPHSRPVTPVRAGRPQEARPLTPHIHVVPAPEEADGPCTKIMIGRTAVVTHSNLTADPKPEPPSIPARTDPILEMTRPKPILGQPKPDPTLDLTRPKPMLGQTKSQSTIDQARLKTTLELARSEPTLDLTRPKPMLGQTRPEPTSGQTRPQRTLDLSRPQLTVELSRPKPTAGQARPQPIVELMRPKPILGQATPDPTLDLTRPKPMLGQAKPQPTVDQARLKTTLEQARPDPTLVLTKPQLTVDQAGPQPTLDQTGLEPPSPILADGSLTPPATEGTRIEDSDSRPVHVQAEHPGSLPLPEGRSPATVHQIGPVPPCEPAAITPPPGFRSTDQEEEKEGVQARLGPEAWESGARVPPVKEKASSVAQCLNIDNMESEEVFEARFKRSKESSLSRSLKQLIRPRSEEKMEQASRPGDLHYRPGGTGQPLQLPKAQDATATNHQQAASRSRSEQNIPEASKDQGFMRKLSLRLKGGPADEGKEEGEGGARKHSWSLGRGGPRGEEEEEAGGTSKKKGPKSSPGLTVRRKIESTISGISMRFGRSQSEERVQEAPAGQSAGPTQREAKESKRPFLSLLRRSTSEAGSLKRVGIPQNQLATQTRSTPSTESLQSDTSLPTKQERGSVQGERKSRWDRWGFSRMKRDKAISQPNISLAVAAEESGAPYHRSASDFPPVFHVKLKDQLLLEGEPLTLCSLPAGSPTPTVTWIKDDCPVASDERVKVVACADGRQLVTLMKTTRADVGVYVCTAANPLGTASSTCSVSLARLPGPPGAPEIPQKYKNTALVLWKAADTPGPCTYTLEYQREGDGRWTVLGSGITDCFFNATELMEGSLSFRLACRNKAGLGPYSRNSGPILIEGNPPAQRESEPSPPATISPVPVYAAKGMSAAISPPAPTLTPPAPSHSSSSSFPTAVTTVLAKSTVTPAPAPKGGPVPAKPDVTPAPAPKGGPVLAKPGVTQAPAPKGGPVPAKPGFSLAPAPRGGPIPSPSLSPARPGPSVTPSRLSPTAKLPDGSGTGLRHGIPQKPYTFMEEKARGRFGVVRECKENSTGKVFMAKIVHYEGENKQAVLQEYEVLKALHHDKVMCLHEAYVTPRYLVLISENCRGKEILYSIIDRFRYSEDDVVCYVQQMLQGLEYLHGRHIVHLDVKPDNVMVTFLNVVKLVDFGSAHFYNPTVPRSLAQRAGTHEYMSPEMMTGDPIGPPADIWGLGVLTYIMLSGRSPFLAPDPDETETRIKSAHFDLTKCYPNASQNAAHFIKRVLCMFPASRPTVRECVANPWLQDNYLMKLRRQTLTFTTTRLKEFLVHHQRRRSDTLTRHRVLLRTYSATPPAPSPPPTQ